ncbi:glutamine--fructose-6-phosphate transaminase (isomerizing) [Alkalilimnicola ehrlichii]|uniref:Glutamine--fructose-6-phosphate aminotransferase [isomerizing] n=1 Tax=Alkalilimnicola ehrlichii TaxID=351052 RepID=A0A3E0X1K0_9GAMM|nr:glutamine--fructose-6-phosphate transaminase (isomerizing) [Alkalilimnicola ehrlichii]RFA30631.1 glutamine--fructose-6-phosphate transaminase (isomerizing) [Alkalilimnicola ehrlichii]RFA38212.1 glutamine--fructose-6-phosphate transaminase (isomerizing) [Alkalilimnicola ehrlichii]
MCGIVGAAAERDVTPILIEGLRRLEYRGYDSAGLAVLNGQNNLERVRAAGKVSKLSEALESTPVNGRVGIAHTRWATHGAPTDRNAHPHICRDEVAIVHNGIIENFEALRETQLAQGYEFQSETDTEVVVHQIHRNMQGSGDLLAAVRATVAELEGAYALGIVSCNDPGRIIAARRGSPLVIGVGIGEHFIASDVFALLPVTQQFIFLEDGDIADIRRDSLRIYDLDGNLVERPIQRSELAADSADRGRYRHYMLKEIHEQPRAITDTLEGRLLDDHVLEAAFGPKAHDIFSQLARIQIVACGTSYHAGMVAKHWMETLAGLPCDVEVASEFRYRSHVVTPGTLFVTISQSGETADTLAALREAKNLGYAATLAICNAPESSLVRESDLTLMTRAGPEIGVASTKAFTTQLVALLLLTVATGRYHRLDKAGETAVVEALRRLPRSLEAALALEADIERLAEQFVDKNHTLFLGRGPQYPVAKEGALKLKEISYIHAEAYPAGELKHGPLALVDTEMPVVAVAPKDDLVEKLKSNLQEVRARGGVLYVFADAGVNLKSGDGYEVLRVPEVAEVIAPIVYTVPLQLLSYHVAVLKGTDVDQPRNLAKSVTVE